MEDEELLRLGEKREGEERRGERSFYVK